MNRIIIAIGAIIIAFVCAFLMQAPEVRLQSKYPGYPGDAWCNSDYAKRIDVNVDNTAGGALTDYQVFVNLTANPINESSLRVYNSTDCTLRPHWCENETGGDCYALWINYSAIAGSAWTNDTSIYYDNDAASSTSDGVSTFKFFDDFEDSSKWTTVGTPTISISNSIMTMTCDAAEYIESSTFTQSPPAILEVRSKDKDYGVANYPATYGFGYYHGTTFDTYGIRREIYSTASYTLITNDHSNCDLATSFGRNTNFADYKIEWTDAICHIYEDDIKKDSDEVTSNIPTGSLKIVIGRTYYSQVGSTFDVDWLFARSYASPEPISALGTEEQPATTPAISNITNGSISATSQWIDWDVNQTAHNRVTYGYTQAIEDTQSCSGDWAVGYECANAYDSNWSTHAMALSDTVAYVYFNYTLPASASQPTTQWHVKDGGSPGERNLTIPAQCWLDPLYLRATSDYTGSHNVYWHCYNGSSWIQLYNAEEVRAIYEQEMLWYNWSSWQNSTAAPHITLSGLIANSSYYFQVWSHNTINTTLSANSSTLNFTTSEAPTTNPITITANKRALLCNWSTNTTFANIAANLTNCTDFFIYNSTTQRWTFYNIDHAVNANTFIDEHAAIFIHFNATTIVDCEVLPAETITIPANVYYYTPLRESTAKTLTEINDAITADGCVITDLYAWDDGYTDTGAYSVLPNEGFAVYAATGCSWDGSV